MEIYYISCLALSYALLVWYLSVSGNKSTYLTLMLGIVVISNAGYLAEVMASNLSEALLAHKILYIGGSYLPMILFLAMCEICQFNIKTWIKTIMLLIQSSMFGMILTVGHGTLYYKTVAFDTTGPVPVLIRTYGPAHIVYPLSIGIYIVSCIVVGIISLKTKKYRVSTKEIFIVLLSLGIAIAVNFGQRSFNLGIDLMPMVYELLSIVLIVPLVRGSAYLIETNASQINEELDNVGYIIFDNKMRYMGCDEFAVKVFPELETFIMHEVPKRRQTLFDDVIRDNLQRCVDEGKADASKNYTVKIDEQTYEYMIAPVNNGRRTYGGYMIALTNITERARNIEIIENYNRNLEREVKGKTHKIREIRDKTILGMAQMVESRDNSTGGHIMRTSNVVGVFAKALLDADLGLSAEFLYDVERSAPMHDLGKIAVDDMVLRKQGKYTDEEYAEMKKHSAAGAEIVRKILTGIEDEGFVEIATNVAHYHHEKYNGTGYPDGLKGEDIPIEARIMALADVFDALVSKRCYKEAFSFDKAFNIIEESAGQHFDENLTKVFMTCRPQLEALYSSFEEE